MDRQGAKQDNENESTNKMKVNGGVDRCFDGFKIGLKLLLRTKAHTALLNSILSCVSLLQHYVPRFIHVKSACIVMTQ